MVILFVPERTILVYLCQKAPTQARIWARHFSVGAVGSR